MPVFSDLNLGLFKQDQDILYDEDALRQQLILRFTTDKKTRVKARDFSSNLNEKLFEPIDDITSEEIRRLLLGITASDNRIQVLMSEVLPDVENQQYYVSFVVFCPALNKEFDLSFNLLGKS